MAGCGSWLGPEVDAATPVPLLPLAELSRAPAADPVPVGFWGLNGSVSPAGLADIKGRLGATTFQVASADPAWAVGTLLPMVRDAGLTVTLRMTGDHDRYTRDGDFDLAAWKAQVDAWQGSGVQAFVDDGTLAGHMLLDDIFTFDGADPTAAELDEMARHSQERLPGLMTFVRCRASQLPVPVAGPYGQLDAAVNQYKASSGDVAAFVATEVAASQRLGLGIIMGLNIADGGDGSSGQPGWRPGRHAMSADEIRAYGSVLAQTPGLGLFLSWEYDGQEAWSDGTIGAHYFDRAELVAALRELSQIVSARPRAALRRP